MHDTHAVTHDYFRQASEDELRELLLIIEQNEHLAVNWKMLVNWANGYEPSLRADRIISIMQEILERTERER